MLTDKAVSILEQVKIEITKEPTHFDMRDWVYPHMCGSVGCIAGWAVCLQHIGKKWFLKPQGKVMDIFPGGIEDEARDMMVLTDSQAHRLFYTINWPWQCKVEYDKAVNDSNWKEAAKVACQRIDLFIASGGEK